MQRQVSFLQSKIDMLTSCTGTPPDREIVARMLDALVKKFTEFGDQATANQYRSMKDDFLRNGTISQDMLNRSLAASSRVDEQIVAQDIDF